MKIVFQSDTGGVGLFENVGQRLEAIGSLSDQGFNYFLGFKDSDDSHPVGLAYGYDQKHSLFKDCIRLVH